MDRKILVIEDNQDLSELIKLHFENESWQVEPVFDGPTGFRKAQTFDYHLVILDIMLPGMDGLEILKQMRAEQIHTPVIMLTSKSSEIDRVIGLEFGADDYVTKPFSVRELVARVKAIFRRIDTLKNQDSEEKKGDIIAGDLTLIPGKRRLLISGTPVELTAKEYDLLYFFAAHPGKVFNRSRLLDQVWGYSHDGYEHVVNSNINRLRAKIEPDPAKPEYILTVWGVGYKFRDTI
ncbi:MAG: response regulator transcription factor [Desulfobacterales bacterium]|nr:response regulator transcription factor [Desulfobacterales bacterium]